MARLVYLKETIKYFYQKYAEYLRPALKLIFSFFVLCMIQRMFQYNMAVNKSILFLIVSVVQAFLPVSFLFYSSSVLILLNLWKVSIEICLAFLILILIFYLIFVRVDSRYAFIIILTPVMFYLKLEYFLPVLLGMTVGFGSILPVAGGILFYFFSLYTEDASALLTTTADSEAGIGVQRIIDLLMIDKKFLVVLISFCLVIFVSTLLYRIFHERAWLFAIAIGNIALALLLLSGRLIFELDYTIWRVFLEVILATGAAFVFQFFEGIGDFSRIEKVSFEDDEYIYYVKAVPKIKVTQKELNVTNIKSESLENMEEIKDKGFGEEKKETDTTDTEQEKNEQNINQNKEIDQDKREIKKEMEAQESHENES